MSYRRACYFCQKHRTSTFGTKPLDGDDVNMESLQCECEGEFNIETHHPSNTLPCNDRHERSTLFSSAPLDQSKQQRSNSSLPSTPPPPLLTPSVHIARSSDIERQLHILYAFVSLPSVHFFGCHLPALESRVVKSVLQPLGVSLGLNAYQKRTMVFPTFLRPTSPSQETTVKSLMSVQSVAIDLLLSLFTFESIRQSCAAFAAATPHLLQRDALHQAYQTWLGSIHAQLTTRLLPLNLTISQLVNHVQDAMTHIPELHALHRSVQNQQTHPLDDSHTTNNAFDYFVAQLREVFMAQEAGPMPDVAGAATSIYNGQFLFDKTVSLVYANSTPDMDISVPTLLRWITMGYAFTLHHTSTSLQITSSLRPFATIPSEFILDATPRVFRVFPNGESSMTSLAGLSHGDYIGQHSPSTGMVSLDFLSWPSADSVTKVSRVSVVLSPTKSGLMATVSWGQADGARGVDYASMNALQRYATYAMDKEAPVASFQFGYSRVK
ncbi:hypothetical protein DYB32_005470 [Aphanomyces invadans]|uniref:Uncharacterized protein n=1 Tax=Aphanomyces invadans TaxID=157072 RepID=A0A3R7CZM3_9STRA|nr:hypothetical protein DYB32_005470 [Aphanomyces invadans]